MTNNETQHTESGQSPPERIAGYKIHPAANLFPLMSEPELQELAADIKANGLHDSILTYDFTNDGDAAEPQILDGRNRALACEIAGVKPKFKSADYGNFLDDPVAYVLSKNLQRRHLTASQRAMIALEVEKHYAEQAKPGARTDLEPRDICVPRLDSRAAVKAAKALDVSPTYVKKAKALVESDPKAAADVKAGKVSLSKATAKPIDISGKPVPVNCSGEPEPVPEFFYGTLVVNQLLEFRRSIVKKIDPMEVARTMSDEQHKKARRNAIAIRAWLNRFLIIDPTEPTPAVGASS